MNYGRTKEMFETENPATTTGGSGAEQIHNEHRCTESDSDRNNLPCTFITPSLSRLPNASHPSGFAVPLARTDRRQPSSGTLPHPQHAPPKYRASLNPLPAPPPPPAVCHLRTLPAPRTEGIVAVKSGETCGSSSACCWAAPGSAPRAARAKICSPHPCTRTKTLQM